MPPPHLYLNAYHYVTDEPIHEDIIADLKQRKAKGVKYALIGALLIIAPIPIAFFASISAIPGVNAPFPLSCASAVTIVIGLIMTFFSLDARKRATRLLRNDILWRFELPKDARDKIAAIKSIVPITSEPANTIWVYPDPIMVAKADNKLTGSNYPVTLRDTPVALKADFSANYFLFHDDDPTTIE